MGLTPGFHPCTEQISLHRALRHPAVREQQEVEDSDHVPEWTTEQILQGPKKGYFL